MSEATTVPDNDPIIIIEPPELQREIEVESESYSDDDKTCLKNFMNSIVKIEQDVQQELIQTPPYKCDKGDRLFRKMHYLQQHMVNHSHKCIDCSKTFPDASTLIIHLKNHKDERYFVCTKCDEAFTTKNHLDQHVCAPATEQSDESIVKMEPQELPIEDIEQEIKEEPESCSDDDKTCLKRFMNSIVKFEEEVQQELIQDLPYKCDKCDRSFKKPHNLKRHMEAHKPECTYCSKTFPDAKTLEIHLKTHMDGKPFLCTMCDTAFITKYKLDRHVCPCAGKQQQNIHAQAAERPYICNLCDKTLENSKHLKSHMLIHSEEQTHKCKICHKICTQSGHLKVHMLLHTGERPHKCKICDKAYTQRGALKLHMLIHTGQRLHKCKVCGKTFRLSNHLKITHACS
ncbi:zinc finger protein OZF-like isoform X1 [Ctenocephalides felis]|uniref:zinc finger protein OZF-like isoform X1 n=1 Tax=Ctenocephalides felis TaxID=7515 RepID=UPI000E6E21B8|nr:zinc finger protein OZF-like isoform X1 [Ctenocephalides felis]XP_026469492.1 zinc finger protein OZF-like isoform X1 [Ctenocephalides felis]